MHGEHLVVDGVSMSKSRGNIIYPEQLASGGHSWKEIRFFLTYRHYRSKLNFTEENFSKTVGKLSKFRSDLAAVKSGGDGNAEAAALIDGILPAFDL